MKIHPKFDETDLQLLHNASNFNRAAIETNALCGCFYCLSIFTPTERPIKEWIDYERTALCPNCGIDSVISTVDTSLAGEFDFLLAMNNRWFADEEEPQKSGFFRRIISRIFDR